MNSEQSELWMDCLEYTCDMRVSFSLLTDSQDGGASPWNVVAIVLQAVGAMDRLMMYVAEGGANVIHLVGALPMKDLFLPQNSAVPVSWFSAVFVLIDRRS
jgi:hypothetical protein